MNTLFIVCLTFISCLLFWRLVMLISVSAVTRESVSLFMEVIIFTGCVSGAVYFLLA